MQVLWLASWYPNPYEPVNGDFVQRHAQAVSRLIPIDLIHVVQVGKDIRTKEGYLPTKDGNLREFIYSFPFRKWGIGWLDKIRYNIKYRYFYRNLLLKYVSQYGKPELIHVHVPMKAGMVAKEFAACWHCPYIVSEHSSMYLSSAPDRYENRSVFFKRNTAAIFRNAKIVTNVSGAIAAKIQEMFNLNHIEIVPNVADTALFNYKPSIGAGVFKWLHVSMLNDQKNVEGIIKAFEKLDMIRQDWELRIAGPAKDHHKVLVKASGLSSKIIFTGELSHEEVAAQMRDSSAFVLFSRYENFPCVIVEALCCGLPVISSEVGGVSEAVNENNGVLVAPENIPALTDALQLMMNNYDQYNRQMIAADAAALYSYETVGDRFVWLYNQLMN